MKCIHVKFFWGEYANGESKAGKIFLNIPIYINSSLYKQQDYKEQC